MSGADGDGEGGGDEEVEEEASGLTGAGATPMCAGCRRVA